MLQNLYFSAMIALAIFNIALVLKDIFIHKK